MKNSMKRIFALVAIFSMMIIPGCGDDDKLPECQQVVSSCVDPCNITCPSGKVEACAGPGYGFKNITENERCCFCVDG